MGKNSKVLNIEWMNEHHQQRTNRNWKTQNSTFQNFSFNKSPLYTCKPNIFGCNRASEQKKAKKKTEIMPFLSLSFFCPIVTILIPPKGDSPDSNCQFKCCFLFVAFTVLSFSFLFVFFSMLFVHRKKKFFLAAIAITPHKHTIAHPPTIVIMWICLACKTNSNSNIATI